MIYLIRRTSITSLLDCCFQYFIEKLLYGKDHTSGVKKAEISVHKQIIYYKNMKHNLGKHHNTPRSVKCQAKGFLLLFALVVTQFGHFLHSPLQEDRVLVDPLKGIHVCVKDFTDLLKLWEKKNILTCSNTEHQSCGLGLVLLDRCYQPDHWMCSGAR